ncbi:MAG: acyl carrier protein [Glaciecola sp.]|jgi:acyl carrier protein
MSSLFELQKVIAVFFDLKLEGISVDTTAHDIQDWDSFSHMELITKIEEHFKLKIPFTEVMEFNCVGDIARHIDSTTET